MCERCGLRLLLIVLCFMFTFYNVYFNPNTNYCFNVVVGLLRLLKEKDVL